MKARDQALIDEKIRSLPPLSQSAIELIGQVADENHDRDGLVRVVNADAALTVRLLGTANSAAFAPLQECTDVGTAIGALGEKLLVAIAFDLSTGVLLHKGLEGYGNDPGELQAQGMKTAIAAQLLADRDESSVCPALAFTGGLIHDIGKVVLSPLLAKYKDAVRENLELAPRDYCAAEREVIGTDHCVIGAEIAKRWGLPAPLLSAVAHHHAPSEAPEEHRGLVDVIHFASVVAMLTGGDSGSDALAHEVDAGVADRLDLSARQLMNVILNTLLEYDRAASCLGG